MKERIIAYDYIRIAAMLLVVACHCFGDVSSTSSTVISLLSYLEAPCNGLFFAVSGALLLPNLAPPTFVNTRDFITKRLKKVAIPTLLWSIIYLALNGELNFLSVCSIPFSVQGASILWFMYTLIGLYMIAPVISPWLEKADKGTLNFYLAIWAVTLCYPIIKNGLTVNESVESMFYYTTGYIGYFILGYYLKRFDIKFRTALILFAIAFLIMMSVKLIANEIRLYDHFWYLTIFCAISVTFYWKALVLISTRIRLTDTARHCLITVSNLIFGVYFLHYGIIEYVLPHIGYISAMPYLLGYASRIAIAFGGALILSYMISYLPFANYLIGYKHKK